MIQVLLAVRIIRGGGTGPNGPLTVHDEQSYRKIETDEQQEKTGELYTRRES